VILLRRANWGEQALSDKAVRKLRIGKSLKLPQERTQITIDGFDTWLENEINKKIQNEVTENVHVTRSGDTLSDIANKYNISIETIKNDNNLTSADIKVGQKLKLPPLDRSVHIKRILELISSFHENINYPDKFLAIHDVIQQNALDKQFINTKKHYKEIEPPRTNTTHFAYTVQSGDNLTKVVKQLKKQYPECTQSTTVLKSMFVHSNKLKNKHAIRSGQNLVLDFPLQRPATLDDIAKKYSVNITELYKLNPAITTATKVISENAILRIPKNNTIAT
ncbi:MAG: LysM peptidoglycan-binding domain-containing protein, partial [Patescibacteria group bacterium]|nr:LysM peptidoglycan-binding domain-containing protein [Patescibacteria group bacterium]